MDFKVDLISANRFLRYDLWSSSHITAFNSFAFITDPSLSIKYANTSFDF